MQVGANILAERVGAVPIRRGPGPWLLPGRVQSHVQRHRPRATAAVPGQEDDDASLGDLNPEQHGTRPRHPR